jgi:phosphomannomutase
MKIAVDAGNGSGGFFATDVLAPLGADVSGSQFLDPDGTFPNHRYALGLSFAAPL